ncbi:MAG: hypothetical protein P1V97_38825, partial [Planctomycetota bacterium]|nr:hypothetical protein [Planctomycetota bacterium]
MNDKRMRELERRVDEGDSEALSALFREKVRSQDPDLQAAAELRAQLKSALFEVHRGFVDFDCDQFLPLALVYSAIDESLNEGCISEDYGCGFRELARWNLNESRIHVVVGRIGDRVRITLGEVETTTTKLTPASLIRTLGTWSASFKAATL